MTLTTWLSLGALVCSLGALWLAWRSRRRPVEVDISQQLVAAAKTVAAAEAAAAAAERLLATRAVEEDAAAAPERAAVDAASTARDLDTIEDQIATVSAALGLDEQ